MKTFFNDIQVLDLNTFQWTQAISPSNQQPEPRGWFTMDWADTAQTMIVMFGGQGEAVDLNDTWFLSVSDWSWTQLISVPSTVLVDGSAVSTIAPSKYSGAMGGTIGNYFYIFGGYNCTVDGTQSAGGSACYSNEVHRLYLNLSNLQSSYWTTVPTYLNVPPTRAFGSSAVYGSRLFVFGGTFIQKAKQLYYNDVAVFNSQTLSWESVSTQGQLPSIR